MAPLYEVILLTKRSSGQEPLKKLLKTCANHIWDKGGVLADIRPCGHHVRRAGRFQRRVGLREV